MKIDSRQRTLHRVPGNLLNIRGLPGLLCLYEDLSKPRIQGIYPRFDPQHLVFGYLIDRLIDYWNEPILDAFINIYEDNPLDGVQIFERFTTFFEPNIPSVNTGDFLLELKKTGDNPYFVGYLNFCTYISCTNKAIHYTEYVVFDIIHAFLIDFINETL